MNEERDASTAEALIQAARRLFTLHGYDGTSVRAITAEAAANLGAITYHFGSKRELYDHVVGSAVRPLAERIEAAVAEAAPVPERVEAVVRTWFDYLAGNPDLPQLMLQELLLAESPPEVVAVPLRRVHVALTGLVEEGQSAGVIRSGPARVQRFRADATSIALFLAKWLTLAFLLESLMLAFVPAEVVTAVLGGQGLAPIATATLVGVPAYLNGYAALPLIGGLIGQGMAPGAGMAFLIAGGVTSIPAAIAVWALVRPPVFALYLALSLFGAFAAGGLYQLWQLI